jgi:hypothetical protein
MKKLLKKLRAFFFFTCCFCGKKDKGVVLYLDPYDLEINERKSTVSACNDCIKERIECI